VVGWPARGPDSGGHKARTGGCERPVGRGYPLLAETIFCGSGFLLGPGPPWYRGRAWGSGRGRARDEAGHRHRSWRRGARGCTHGVIGGGEKRRTSPPESITRGRCAFATNASPRACRSSSSSRRRAGPRWGQRWSRPMDPSPHDHLGASEATLRTQRSARRNTPRRCYRRACFQAWLRGWTGCSR